MFYHYATFLHKLQPKIFLFENVKGLLTHDKGRTYKTILDIFQDEGYKIQYQVLNAVDYEVPQKRERLITIGIREDLVNKCEFNFPKNYSKKLTIKDIKLDKNPSKEECMFYTKKKKKYLNLFLLVDIGKILILK